MTIFVNANITRTIYMRFFSLLHIFRKQMAKFTKLEFVHPHKNFCSKSDMSVNTAPLLANDQPMTGDD